MEERHSRIEAEVALLQTMYPDSLLFSPKSQEVTHKTPLGTLALRLPDSYPSTSRPDPISASSGKTDLRADLKKRIADLAVGEEVLDSMVAIFDELCQEVHAGAPTPDVNETNSQQADAESEAKLTTIIYLHHLLNTNKRKLALSPPSAEVHGLSKPGYPGVLVYSGPAAAVREHVNELKQQNWAAFQVRMESEEEWTFGHGKGVREVEGMGEVVGGVGEGRRGEFMEAMRMK
ncbi:hypothetical protein LTR62_000862 [Meristemomyces frigidus]|uniref:RWD domain-containing protein n=1 Tax=Meristemomyces frigidus TaxID=1508187 RepID=A0AAN7YQU2_9PEZI|nr:hypothetical protein LTR62_000862 [Meristemomyces frigidus]